MQEQKDPMLFAKRVRQVMAKEMGAPLVEQVGRRLELTASLGCFVRVHGGIFPVP